MRKGLVHLILVVQLPYLFLQPRILVLQFEHLLLLLLDLFLAQFQIIVFQLVQQLQIVVLGQHSLILRLKCLIMDNLTLCRRNLVSRVSNCTLSWQIPGRDSSTFQRLSGQAVSFFKYLIFFYYFRLFMQTKTTFVFVIGFILNSKLFIFDQFLISNSQATSWIWCALQRLLGCRVPGSLGHLAQVLIVALIGTRLIILRYPVRLQVNPVISMIFQGSSIGLIEFPLVKIELLSDFSWILFFARKITLTWTLGAPHTTSRVLLIAADIFLQSGLVSIEWASGFPYFYFGGWIGSDLTPRLLPQRLNPRDLVLPALNLLS